MQKFIGVAALALSVITQSGCDGQRLVGSGNVSTETRTVGEYHKVALKGFMDVEFTQGPAQAAVIEAEDNIIPYITLEVHGDQLVVDIKDHISIKSHKDVKIRLTAPDVHQLSLSGSGNLRIMNTLENEEPVKINLAGSGNVEGAVNSPKISASSAGSGNISLKGETKDLDLNIAGSGNFEGEELHTESTDITIAGSGNADVHASVRLEAKIMGSGDVSYKGSPQVSSKIVGSGSVHKKG
jgi:carbon monoxide dehydrogenase subunit G